MQIYINKEEIEAVRNAWEHINSNLESCTDDDSVDEMREMLKHLEILSNKYRNRVFTQLKSL